MEKSFDEQLTALKEDARQNNIQTGVLHEINTMRDNVTRNNLNIALINETMKNTMNEGESANIGDGKNRRRSFGVTFNTEPTSQDVKGNNLPSTLPSSHISSKERNSINASVINLNNTESHHATLPPHPNMNMDISYLPDTLLQPPNYNKTSSCTSLNLPTHPKVNMDLSGDPEKLPTPPNMTLPTKDFNSHRNITNITDLFRGLSTDIDLNQLESGE